jgi:epoxyqueuosine reductase
MTYIGYILTDLEISEYDQPIASNYCGGCTKCLDACPNQAITGDGKVNRERCISQLTQLKTLTDEMRGKMGNQIYGCDLCQLACPYNQHIANKKHPALINSQYSLEHLLALSNKEFKETIKVTSAGWKGKKILQRNAIIALSKTKTRESVMILAQHIADIRQDIRLEIAKALIEINTTDSQQVLQNMMKIEENEDVKSLITNYIY